jgi:hypothetical protein
MGVPHVNSTDLWLLHVLRDLTCQNSVFCLHGIFMCFTLTSEQMSTIFWYNINRLVSTVEIVYVYSMVWTEL